MSNGCAQNDDGTLRDASEIQWYNDVDDETPIAGPSSSSGTPIHPLFTSIRPLHNIGGARRSSPRRRSAREHRPSARVMDPDNVESTARHKRKAPADPVAPRKARKTAKTVVPDSSSDSEGSAGDDTEHADDCDHNHEHATDRDDDDNEPLQAANEKYEEYKVMGDADHAHATAKLSREDSTADVKTVFDRVKKDIANGVFADGAYCKVCIRKGVSKANAFHKGSVTSLRLHIKRHGDHFKVYEAGCAKIGVEMHLRAIPNSPKGTQTTLDGVVVSAPRPPPYTGPGMRDHILQLIVVKDQAFSLVEAREFFEMLQFLRPGIKRGDIPTRNTIRKYIMRLADEVEDLLRDEFRNTPSKHSFSHDAWTSDSGIPFLNVNNHYIRSPPDHPNDWEMVTDQLAFMRLDGRHNGNNIGSAILKTIARYELHGKVGWVTSDGAAVNRSAARIIEDGLDHQDAGWTAKENDMMCMEHAVHKATQHFVESVAPTPPKPLHKKIRALLGEARNSGELTESEVAELISALNGGNAPEDSEDEEESEWTAGDALGKVLAFIKQLRMSPQALTFFKKCCVQSQLNPLVPVLWIRTRWGSLEKCVGRVLALRKPIELFIALADSSDEVPDLRNKQYSDYALTKPEWVKLSAVYEALREPADVTQTFSSERMPTVWRIIPVLEFLLARWETMATQPQFSEIKPALLDGVENLRKWSNRVGSTSSAYFICLVLNPNVKDVYFRTRWGTEEYNKGMEALRRVFDQYHEASMSDDSHTSTMTPTPAAEPPVTAAQLTRYGSSFLLNTVKSVQQAERAKADPRDELNGYLSSPLEEADNILHWWGHNTSRPTLRRMARDYLPIQGSSTAAERAFSSGSLTGTKQRNSLSAETFEALQLLKSAYRNGHINARNLSSKHIDALIAELDENMGYSDEDVEVLD